jgi:glycosyltransferase involved in cell wall biosynthesis
MKKVFLKSPLLSQSGYGHHSRTVLKALRAHEGELFDIYLQILNWGATSWLHENTEERRWIDAAVRKTVEYANQGGQFDMSIQISIPQEWEMLAPINIGVTAGVETTKVSPLWLQKVNMMDRVLTISEHSKSSFVNSSYEGTHPETGQEIKLSCETPIDVISYPVNLCEPESLDLELETNFNFLSVMQLSPRKNLNQLVNCFIEQFKDNEDVGLIVKTNMAKNSLIDKINCDRLLKTLISAHNYDIKCKIYLLHGYMSEEEMTGLYTHPKIKALVSTTHGEGFGLPLFEAAYNGLPICATDWSGHLDFLYKKVKQKNGKTKNKHMFNRISYTLQPVQKEAHWENIIVPESKWAFPEAGSVKMNLEEIYKDHGRFKKTCQRATKMGTRRVS